MNMRTSSTRPPSCMYCFGELSLMVGTPANMLFPSERDSARSSSKPPPRARFLQKWGKREKKKKEKRKSSLVRLALIDICKILSDNLSKDLSESEEWLALHRGMCWSVLDFPAIAALSTPGICGNTAFQGSPAPTTQVQLLQWLLQHRFSCVKVILYLRFSHIHQSSSEVALRKQSSSTAKKLHIDRAVVSPECSSCAVLPSEGWKGNSKPSLRAWQESSCL